MERTVHSKRYANLHKYLSFIVQWRTQYSHILEVNKDLLIVNVTASQET